MGFAAHTRQRPGEPRGMFPRRAGADTAQQRRERGNPKPGVNFRLPPDLLKYVHEQAAKGYTKTAVILALLDIARCADETMGLAWHDVEKMADAESVAPGVILGRLALLGLEVDRARAPKKK